MKLKILVFLILFVFTQSCKTEKKNEIKQNFETPIRTKVNPTLTSFDTKLKEEPKIFLKFWSGMSKNEYQKVVEILISEKVLKGQKRYDGSFTDVSLIHPDGCNYFNNNLSIYPKFNYEEDKLIGIEIFKIKCLWDLYIEKYKIQPFDYKMAIEEKFIENNPNYQPEFTNVDEKGNTYNLNNAFIDRNLALNKGRVKLKIQKNHEVPLLVENPFIIENDSTVLMFEHIEQEFKSTTYSLEQSESLKNYFATDEGSPLSNINKNENKFISTNSVLRTVEIGSNYIFKVTYMSNSDYKKKLETDFNKKNDSILNLENKEKKIKNILEKI
ncbi:hypothetical protein [Winogradskyella sediminis]|uniref:hypothetical protein n=1 Tax=Winogradskyella sediminis TaxID=1382466 RepID=UPI003AA7ECCD